MRFIIGHRLQQICEDAGTAIKAYGEEMARRIHMRIDQIGSADSVEQLVRYRIGRCHPLTGNRKGQYAMDLVHPYRLVLAGIDDSSVKIRIEEVTDYH